MSGEYYSTCSAGGGTGKRTIGSTSIGSGTQPRTESCSRCSGTGQILGGPATVQDLQAYASEPCEVEDQIFALAKQVQQPRQGRVAHQVVDRRTRQVSVRKQRKVGGFLGIGAKIEYYDEVETQPYDEVHTEYVDQLI